MKNSLLYRTASILFLFFSLWAFPATVKAQDVSSGEKTGVFLNEIGIGTGYAWGALKGDSEEQSVFPAFVRFGFNANSLFGIRSRTSTLQFTLEPFVNAFSGSEDGVEAGCGFGIRYLQEVVRPVDLFLEISAAPMYYSIDTLEQGASGFNFLDQIGAGLQYRLAPGKAVFGGYRFRHISHANVVDRSNDGINSSALVLGFSWLY